MSKLAWKNMSDYSDDCECILKKNGITIFKIMSARDHYYTWYVNRIFESRTLSYFKASELAKKEFGEDSLDNRLKVAKRYFLDDFKNQTSDIRTYLDISEVNEEVEEA